MKEKSRTAQTPDWRDSTSYEYTLSLPKQGWAWECLRRNPEFRKAGQGLKAGPISGGKPGRTVRVATTVQALQSLENWGVLFFDDLDKTAEDALVFWRPRDCPFVVPVWAIEVDGAARVDCFGLSRIGCRKAVLVTPEDSTHLLLTEAGRAIQLIWKGADVLNDRLVLAAPIELFSRTDRERLAMRRLWALQRRRSIPRHLFGRHPGSKRLRMALQALDGRLAGASWRQVAAAVFGENKAAEAWAGDSRWLLDKTRRLFWQGEAYMKGKYREFLR
jgi:hypothetical protein